MECTGHDNGFVHLDDTRVPGLSGAHLAVKFHQHDPQSSRVDPESGSRAWAEPVLDLYISVHRPTKKAITLTYRLSRSDWQSIDAPSESDHQRALKDACDRLAHDLERIPDEMPPGFIPDVHAL